MYNGTSVMNVEEKLYIHLFEISCNAYHGVKTASSQCKLRKKYSKYMLLIIINLR